MTERQSITLPVTFEAANRKKDGSVSCRLNTTLEVSTDDFAELDRTIRTNNVGHLIFVQNGRKAPEIPKEDAPDRGIKSQSERLYGTLYALHMARGGKPENFDAFRRAEMEFIMSEYKQLIEQAEAEHGVRAR